MDIHIPGEVTAAVIGEVGDGLRTMGLYRNGDLEFGYLREDIDEQYTEEDYQAISELFVFEAFDSREAEEVFQAGEIEYIAYGLEEAVVYQYIDDPLGGFFFSVDSFANPDPSEVQDRLISFVDAREDAAPGGDREPADDLQELFLA